MNEPILVWRYHNAPKELQISTNGGDEDWLAELPPDFTDDYIPWIESSSFGGYETLEMPHPTKTGWTIRIGVHA